MKIRKELSRRPRYETIQAARGLTPAAFEEMYDTYGVDQQGYNVFTLEPEVESRSGGVPLENLIAGDISYPTGARAKDISDGVMDVSIRLNRAFWLDNISKEEFEEHSRILRPFVAKEYPGKEHRFKSRRRQEPVYTELVSGC